MDPDSGNAGELFVKELNADYSAVQMENGLIGTLWCDRR
jgi:hypothetical protein